MRRAVMFLTLTASLSFSIGCAASLVIKTWFLDASIPALVRRDSRGVIVEQKELRDADGYRCYSRSDDEAWRTDFSRAQACCNSKR